MTNIVVTEGPPLPEGSCPRSMAGPGRETDDERGQVPDFTERTSVHSCGHSAGIAPASLLTAPADPMIVGGTLVGKLATAGPGELSIGRSHGYGVGMERFAPTMDNKARLLALLAAIFAAAALRLAPHPPNFSPIAAMALFSGAYLPRKLLSFVASFGALVLSDIALGGLYPGMNFVYLSFALTVLIGWTVAQRKTPLVVGSAAIAGSILFFVLTNFGMWMFSGIYPLTQAGLAACYVAAIPFFQNTLVGDLLFTALLFGGFALAEHYVPQLRAGQPEAA